MMNTKHLTVTRKVQEKFKVKGVLRVETSITEDGREERGESGTSGVDQTGSNKIVIQNYKNISTILYPYLKF